MTGTTYDTIRRWGRWLAILPLVFSACRPYNGVHEKKLNRRITLWREDKIPYGCYAAYKNLSSLFPDAEIGLNKRSPIFLDGYGGSKKVYIIIAPEVDPDPVELRGLMNFLGQGNSIFISSFRFGDSLLRSLNVKQAGYNPFSFFRDSLRLSVYDPLSHDSLSFVYPGESDDDYAASIDSQYTSILGRDARGRPDFIRLTYKGGGALYLHFAPMALTNFFLLHKQNMDYYDKLFSYMPASAGDVKWDDYFRYSEKPFSAFRYIAQNPPLQWALWLSLLLFLVIYLFESKRRQRKIPVIPALSNTSLDFVKTIGRLYYQRRDNHNLALKMAAHFQEIMRTRYNLPSSTPDEELISRLSHKTDLSREFLREIVTAIRGLQEGGALTDEELLKFSGKLNQFYKQV
jgi:hypothetical protein